MRCQCSANHAASLWLAGVSSANGSFCGARTAARALLPVVWRNSSKSAPRCTTVPPTSLPRCSALALVVQVGLHVPQHAARARALHLDLAALVPVAQRRSANPKPPCGLASLHPG